MRLLIDADYIVYKCCASAEDEIDWGDDVIMVVSQFSDAYRAVERDIMRIQDLYMNPEVVLFFSDSVNFRKKIFELITRVTGIEKTEWVQACHQQAEGGVRGDCAP